MVCKHVNFVYYINFKFPVYRNILDFFKYILSILNFSIAGSIDFNDMETLHTSLVKENYYHIGNREVDLQDEQYLSGSAHLERVLNILSDFGKNGRYYNINYLIDPKSISPILEWEKLERDLSSLTEKEWFKPKEKEGEGEKIAEEILKHKKNIIITNIYYGRLFIM